MGIVFQYKLAAMITSLSVNTGGLGRFGNTMWTIAGTIGIAIKNGQPFGFKDWVIKDNELFGGTADHMADYFLNPLPEISGDISFNNIPYHWEYKDYNIPYGNWNICSHLQDPRYFKDYMPIIRHFFRMKDEPEQNDYVAIHYRAGDYIDDPDAYHPRCSKEYYLKAMSMFPKGTRFAVFSDSPDAWYNLMGDDYEDVNESAGGHYMEDFRQMKRCKSFITANSSFSAMAAVLGEHPEKKIVMPSRWFGKQANGLQSYIYPEGAIII